MLKSENRGCHGKENERLKKYMHFPSLDRS